MQFSRQSIAAVAIMLGAFMALAGINITNTATELLQARVGASLREMTLITSSYIIAEIAAMPLMPVLVRRLGLKRLAVCVLCGFMLASVACAHANSLDTLIVWRIVQGAFGGILLPLVHTSIKLLLPQNKHAAAFGVFSVFASLAPVAGPAYAGLLSAADYPWLFYINIPLGLAALTGLLWALPGPDSCGQVAEQRNCRLDAFGIAILSLSLASLVFALEHGVEREWLADQTIRASLVCGLIGLMYIGYLQTRLQQPVLNVRLLASSRFALICLASFMAGVVIYGFVYLIPYYLISVHGYSPAQVARVILMAAAPQLLMLPLMVKYAPRLNPWLAIVAGALLCAVSTALCSRMTVDFAGDQFLWPQLIRVIAVPLLIMPLTLLSLQVVSDRDAPSAAILFNVARNLGGAVGVAGLVTYVEHYKVVFFQQSLLQFNQHTLPMAQSQNSNAFASQLTLQLNQHSSIWAFNGAFSILSVSLLLMAILFLTLYLLDGKYRSLSASLSLDHARTGNS
ncbi:DHA2 family efflux MFS transporter permease subunit [Arsukibacterium sp.]|uniref:DHA2 family efflux MFS transporter permease subunit n=1 Tax=Arsukibacterium sp. TaxID=1977258 RepID=UPI001BD4452B|nr:DHA2 family efflux MFS transporter permease subunit [Arsukibacterium sp.]